MKTALSHQKIPLIPPFTLEVSESQLFRAIGRMEGFSIDVPGAARPFSRRLQEEQGWSAQFTERAIEEYKRFMVLAATLGDEVTPSKTVDEVWHTHLLYSKNYRDEMCTKVLGKVIDHNPGNGGTEDDRYIAQYVRTIITYQTIFGEAPPADIWPLTATEKRYLTEMQSSKKTSERGDRDTSTSSGDSGPGYYAVDPYDSIQFPSAPANDDTKGSSLHSDPAPSHKESGFLDSIKSLFGGGDSNLSTESHSGSHSDGGHHGGGDGGDGGGSGCSGGASSCGGGSGCGGGGCGGGGCGS